MFSGKPAMNPEKQEMGGNSASLDYNIIGDGVGEKSRRVPNGAENYLQAQHGTASPVSKASESGSTPDLDNADAGDEELNLGTTEEKQGWDKDFEVSFEGDDDPGSPKSISKTRKWLIVFTIAFSSFCVTFNSSVYTFTYDQLEKEFGASREVATLGLSLFVVGLGIGPMFLAPLSEFYGRKVIYLGALAAVCIWIIPCAVAPNMETIIVTRFLDGIGASAFLSVAGGTIGDIFVKSDLSLPMMIYSGSPFIGPALGPVVGGFVNQYASWRWTFWILLIWTAVQLGLIALLVPETYVPVLLREKAKKIRKETGDDRWHAPIEVMDKTVFGTILVSCKRPFQLLFLEPMVLLLCTLTAILLGVLYLFFGAFALVFERNHGFDLHEVGLSFLGIFVGMILGIFSDRLWQRNYRRLLRNRERRTGEEGVTEPEWRLPPTIFGTQCVWIGLFAFGWTTFSSVHWIVPIVLSSLIGFGIVTTYSGVFTFLVESYPLYAASALAANSIARSTFAAVFPLFGNQLYENLGYQWASSLLAFITLALAPAPYIFFRHGSRIRKWSKYASHS